MKRLSATAVSILSLMLFASAGLADTDSASPQAPNQSQVSGQNQNQIPGQNPASTPDPSLSQTSSPDNPAGDHAAAADSKAALQGVKGNNMSLTPTALSAWNVGPGTPDKQPQEIQIS